MMTYGHIDLDEMHAFCLVAATRNFRVAADIKGITAELLSDKIRRLEARLRIRLIDRDNRFRGLTEEGEAYLLHAAPALLALEAAMERLRDGLPEVEPPDARDAANQPL